MGWLTVSVLVRWLLGWVLSWHLPLLPRGSVQGQPSISVLIPARNEAGTLPNLLASLSRQHQQPLEVIVIDDHSSDGTAAIARAAAGRLPLKVIAPPPLPPGWCGKTFAVVQPGGAAGSAARPRLRRGLRAGHDHQSPRL